MNEIIPLTETDEHFALNLFVTKIRYEDEMTKKKIFGKQSSALTFTEGWRIGK